MSERIFETEAPKYWAQNLPVVPVEGKAAVIKGWTGFLASNPNETKQKEWTEQHAEKNIGLLMGFAVGAEWVLIGLDIDDDRLINLVLRLLGLSRQQRRALLSGKKGKKGATIFVRAAKSLKSTVIKGTAGLGNIDVLAAGKMTVMPPSIHPDTGKPYEVMGEPLLPADLSALPEFTKHHLDLHRAVLGSEHTVVIISGEATHDAGVALTGVLVKAGATDDEITEIFQGLLPEGYTGDSLDELPEWIESARAKGFDQNQSGAKSQTAALVAVALDSGMMLFNDGRDEAYANLPDLGEAVAVRLGSSTFSHRLRYLAYNTLGRAINGTTLREAVATLEAIALFERPAFSVFARIAGGPDRVLIDLGGADGKVVSIDRNGWQVGQQGAHKFVRGAGFGELREPRAGGSLKVLQTFLGLDDAVYRLLIAFLINALSPTGPYFVLLVEGEQGSGKSFFCEIIKRIIDPNLAMRLRLPEKPQDLMIQAKEYRLLSFDNASGMKAEMSDALCTLATGGGLAVRKLYSDGELYVMSYARPFVINGIGGYATRPDLMERAIPITLSAMAPGERKTEAELFAEFELILPDILGALYDAVSHALRVYGDIEPPRHLRMADAARWIAAAEEGLGEEPGAILGAISMAQHTFVVDKINDDQLTQALRRIASPIQFEGYAGDLFVKFMELGDFRHQPGLPKSPSALTNQLTRMRPALAKAGIIVEDLGRDRRGRRLRVRLQEPEEPSATGGA